MSKRNSLGILTVFIIFSWVAQPVLAGEPFDQASQYLFEYGKSLYLNGNIPDAIHELNKCLMINQHHCQAIALLRQISPIIELKSDALACPLEVVDFEAKVLDNPGIKNYALIWDFGDGVVEEGGLLNEHQYLRGGRYRVKVTLAPNCGTCPPRDEKILEVKVASLPVANAGVNLACCVNKESIFDGSASYDPDGGTLTYSWNFGDGSNAKGKKVNHRYAKAGTYKVILTVKDNSGLPCDTASDSFTATVGDKPVSVMQIRQKK